MNLGAAALAGCALGGCKPLLSMMGGKPRAGAAAMADAAPKPLPAFEFRGLRPGVTTYAESRRSLALHYCRDLSDGGSCRLRDPSVGGVYALQASATFEKDVLSAIRITYPSGAYVRLRQAVVAAYGKPCETGTEELADAGGTRLTSATTAWCFADGKLELAEYQDGNDGQYTGRFAFTLLKAGAPAKGYDTKRL